MLAHSSGLEDRLRPRVDLAAVVNKYIGETEKNLRCVFDMAEGIGVILLFNEADVFFGRHTGVRVACDRCAKLKANYLLRLIEDCKGTVVLSTNPRESIDSAFPRCMDMLFEFPLPSLEKHRKLWGENPPYPLVDEA